MGNGIAILILIIVLLVVGGIALAFFGAGGSELWRRADRREDRAEPPHRMPPARPG